MLWFVVGVNFESAATLTQDPQYMRKDRKSTHRSTARGTTPQVILGLISYSHQTRSMPLKSARQLRIGHEFV
jgi:hypothetical protein